MADFLNSILSQLSDGSIESMSQKINASPDQTKEALSSAIPLLVSALAKNSSSQDGAASLQSALERDHDGSILDNISDLISNPSIGNGQGILKHVLGNKQDAAKNLLGEKTGLSSSAIGNILEMAAPMVMGYLGRQTRSNSTGGGITDVLSSMLGGQGSASNQNQSLFNKLLDRDGDGSAIDDVAEMGMSFLGKLLKKKK